MSAVPSDVDVVVAGTGFASTFFLHEFSKYLGPRARVLVFERGGRAPPPSERLAEAIAFFERDALSDVKGRDAIGIDVRKHAMDLAKAGDESHVHPQMFADDTEDVPDTSVFDATL